MARERTITRTFTTLEIELTVFNKSTKQTSTSNVIIPKFKTEKEMTKFLDSHYNDGEIRWVEVGEITEHNDLYAITEADFLKYAHKVEKNNIKEDK